MDIIFTDKNDKEIKRINVGKYKGSSNMEFSGNFLEKGASSEYKVYLRVYGSLENKVVYYPVEFANENIYNNNLKAHFLFTVKDGVISGSGTSKVIDDGSKDDTKEKEKEKEKEKPKETEKDKDKTDDNITTNDRCGVYNQKRCPKGWCCSTFGHCGQSDDFCIKYCDPKWGECKTQKREVSTDGLCGKKNQKSCPDGECCSTHGYCGQSYLHCGLECDSQYGQCKKYEVTKDERCGSYNGKICPDGYCCSTFGHCGKSDDFCIKYCDKKFSVCKN